MIEANSFFSRYTTSKEYTTLLDEYKEMHKSAEGMFNGRSLVKFVDIIKHYLKRNHCKSFLDYGCGKGYLYTKDFRKVTKAKELPKSLPEYWNIDNYKLYDPGHEEHNELPLGKFDAVICTDVLEHIPESDLRWVTQEIFGFAKKIVFLNIACMAALKKLKDGRNAHVSLFPSYDWLQFLAEISERYPHLVIYVFADEFNEEEKLETSGYKIVRRPNIIPLTKLEDGKTFIGEETC